MTRPLLSSVLLLPLLGCPGPGESPPPTPTATPTPSAGDPLDVVGGALVDRTRPPGEGPRVAMFYPHEDLFWRDFHAFMQACADQLGVTLVTFQAHNDHELMKEQLREVTRAPAVVDAVLFQDFKQCGADMLAIAEAAGVPAFMVNTTVGPEHGAPRERNPSWIGTMVSDDEQGGYDLAEALADEALRLGLTDDEGRVQVIALAGFVSESGSINRLRGLERLVAERDDVELLQRVPTDWSQAEGRRKAAVLLERFPEADVVWAASDPLALGAIESIQATDKRPGKDLVVGGFDWTPEALDAIARGDMFITLGGHTLEGGWALILVHDYLRGNDFAPTLEFLGPLRAITRENVARFQPTIAAGPWDRVDFRALTNPGDRGYRFDPVETLESLSR